jgi:SAM-dependent methyltransferase
MEALARVEPAVEDTIGTTKWAGRVSQELRSSSMAVSYGATSRFYDALYEAAGKDYLGESVDLHRLVQERCPGARDWLDVACGTGAHLAHLAQDYDVVGVDLSAEMLVVASSRVPQARLVQADMRSFRLRRQFDVVSCLFSAVAYMPTIADLTAAISTMAAHLRPGGLLVVDGWIRPSSWRDPGTVQALAADLGTTVVARVIRSAREGAQTTLELHFLLGSATTGVEHVTETHHLMLFSDSDYRRAFDHAALRTEVVASPHPDRDRYLGSKAPHRGTGPDHHADGIARSSSADGTSRHAR